MSRAPRFDLAAKEGKSGLLRASHNGEGASRAFQRADESVFLFLTNMYLVPNENYEYRTNICFRSNNEERVPPFWLKMSHVIYFFVCRILESIGTTSLSVVKVVYITSACLALGLFHCLF